MKNYWVSFWFFFPILVNVPPISIAQWSKTCIFQFHRHLESPQVFFSRIVKLEQLHWPSFTFSQNCLYKYSLTELTVFGNKSRFTSLNQLEGTLWLLSRVQSQIFFIDTFFTHFLGLESVIHVILIIVVLIFFIAA